VRRVPRLAAGLAAGGFFDHRGPAPTARRPTAARTSWSCCGPAGRAGRRPRPISIRH
jgi:hypothetical protein